MKARNICYNELVNQLFLSILSFPEECNYKAFTSAIVYTVEQAWVL